MAKGIILQDLDTNRTILYPRTVDKEVYIAGEGITLDEYHEGIWDEITAVEESLEDKIGKSLEDAKSYTDSIKYNLEATAETALSLANTVSSKVNALSVDGAITTNRLADGAVTIAKIANKAITKDKIADDAVTSGKIKDRAVTMDKLSVSLESVINSTLDDLDIIKEDIAKFNPLNRLNEYYLYNFYDRYTANLTERFMDNKAISIAPSFNFEDFPVERCSGMFTNCTNLVYVPEYIIGACMYVEAMFYGCTNLLMIEKLDFYSVINADSIFRGCTNLEYCIIDNLGYQPEFVELDMSDTKWGQGGVLSEHSINQTFNNAFNRAEYGYQDCTIRVNNKTYNIIKYDLAKITAKGYNIVVV